MRVRGQQEHKEGDKNEEEEQGTSARTTDMRHQARVVAASMNVTYSRRLAAHERPQCANLGSVT